MSSAPGPWSLGELQQMAPDDGLMAWRQQILDANGAEIAAVYTYDEQQAREIATVMALAPEAVTLTSQLAAWYIRIRMQGDNLFATAHWLRGQEG